MEWTLGQLPMTTLLINELLAHCGIKASPVTILNLYFELYLCITFVNFNFNFNFTLFELLNLIVTLNLNFTLFELLNLIVTLNLNFNFVFVKPLLFVEL